MNDVTAGEHESIAALSESRLVSMLLADRVLRADLLNVHGFPSNAVTAECRELGTLPGKPKGDVDILVWQPGVPECAVAIEVKRLKSVERDEEQAYLDISKRSELEKGIKQAQRLLGLGFWRVHLWPIVTVDSRGRNSAAHAYAGLWPGRERKWESALEHVGRRLDGRIGLIGHQLVQSADAAPLRVGTRTASWVRGGVAQSQASDVTAWVTNIEREL